ncbi:CD63 antigen-like [Ctenocephalides felis]|nr:CD63 antigen-like [Ctenocephalides felis]
MVSAGMTCVKYLLFCFNLIFALSGLTILIVGALIQSSFHHYSEFVNASVWSAPVLLIVIGAIAFVIAFFGCCGAVKESNCMIYTFAVFLIGIFILELSAGIAGYIKHGELAETLENNFNTSMNSYIDDKQTRATWDVIQEDLDCCGMNGPSD